MTECCGIIYIVFGENAHLAAKASIASLRLVNTDIPVVVVGDECADALVELPRTTAVRWQGKSPYDSTRQHNFQFRAGRVKPFLYGLSPFEKTLYVDADTEFQQDPAIGFALLDRYDFMVAKHSSHNVGMLNNDPSTERLTTIAEIGGNGDQPYPNSGVLFWRSCQATSQLFEAWSNEWLRFQEWDEQLALMRAMFKNPLRMLLLPEAWNGENKTEGKIIFHDFHGTQIARSNVEKTLPDVFKTIHDTHYWKSTESLSGPGSDTANTQRIREFLPLILRSLSVASILDAGCGDWNWMSKVNLEGIKYRGCDIVPDLIAGNQHNHPGHDFFIADLTKANLPTCDLILCRSVLFHLAFANVGKVLRNFKASGAKWLLTTTYPYFNNPNQDIQDGHWHRINLEKPPFNWPAPYLLMVEGNEPDGWLGLWKLEEIPDLSALPITRQAEIKPEPTSRRLNRLANVR